MTLSSSTASDVIDEVLALDADHPVHALRRERPKVVAATQASYEGMFASDVQGISVNERLLVALLACRLSRAGKLAAHYRSRLLSEGADAALVDAVDAVDAVDKGNTPAGADARLAAMLGFTAKLIDRPIEGDRAAINALVQVGLNAPSIVALGQLIAFLSYQVRMAAGLQAMADAGAAA